MKNSKGRTQTRSGSKIPLIDKYTTESRHKIATHSVYCAVHEQYANGNISLARANNVVGTMLAAGDLGRRVIGITHNALDQIHEVNYLTKPKGITRAHIFKRIETMKLLLKPDTPLTAEKLFRRWKQSDKMVLCAKGENGKINSREYLKFRNPNGQYFTSAYIGYSYSRDRDGDLLRKLFHNQNLATEHLNRQDLSISHQSSMAMNFQC